MATAHYEGTRSAVSEKAQFCHLIGRRMATTHYEGTRSAVSDNHKVVS
jgi:hypothetical protein